MTSEREIDPCGFLLHGGVILRNYKVTVKRVPTGLTLEGVVGVLEVMEGETGSRDLKFEIGIIKNLLIGKGELLTSILDMEEKDESNAGVLSAIGVFREVLDCRESLVDVDIVEKGFELAGYVIEVATGVQSSFIRRLGSCIRDKGLYNWADDEIVREMRRFERE